MYYLSLKGPVMFDGQRQHLLYKRTPWKIDAPIYPPLAYGWYNPLWDSIHFNRVNSSIGTRWAIQEDPIGLVEGKSAIPRACDYPLMGAYWSLNQPYLTDSDVYVDGAGTVIARKVEESIQTENFSGDEIWGSVRWAGIVGKEGPTINKVVKKIWVTYMGGINGHTTLNYEIGPDADSVVWGSLAGSATLTAADTLQTIALDPAGANCLAATPAWTLALEIPADIHIYSVRIEYGVGGHV